MQYFVLSDPHGFTTLMKKALAEKGFDVNNPNHKLIICGDVWDRGDEPVEMIDYLNSLGDKLIFVRGNHEDLFFECNANLARHDYLFCSGSHHYHNGTVDTIETLREAHRYNDAVNLINKSVNYFETEHYIFVHGWIPNDGKYDPNWRNADKTAWEEARWMNGMAKWYEGIREPNKTIVCGHYHSSWGNSRLHNDGKEFLERIETVYIDPETGKQEPHANYGPFIDNDIIAIDACTAYTKQINIIIIDD